MKDPLIDNYRMQAARHYVEDCLVFIDGSIEAGIRRIGTDGFEKIVRDVYKAMPGRANEHSKICIQD